MNYVSLPYHPAAIKSLLDSWSRQQRLLPNAFCFFIAYFFQQCQYLCFAVALNDDFAIFGRAAYTAFVFEDFFEGFEVIVAANKALYERNGFAASMFAVE